MGDQLVTHTAVTDTAHGIMWLHLFTLWELNSFARVLCRQNKDRFFCISLCRAAFKNWLSNRPHFTSIFSVCGYVALYKTLHVQGIFKHWLLCFLMLFQEDKIEAKP